MKFNLNILGEEVTVYITSKQPKWAAPGLGSWRYYAEHLGAEIHVNSRYGIATQLNTYYHEVAHVINHLLKCNVDGELSSGRSGTDIVGFDTQMGAFAMATTLREVERGANIVREHKKKR